jgi:hypothetical protein
MDESPIRRNTRRAIIFDSPGTPDREEFERWKEAREARKTLLRNRFLREKKAEERAKSLRGSDRNWKKNVWEDTPPGTFYPQHGDEELMEDIRKEYYLEKRKQKVEAKKKRQQQNLKWERTLQCVGCAQPAQLACSACLEEFYCSKECQESSKQCNC